ncbi:MAG: hypothetical protein JWN52_7160 [Actinomycetia bacterium]|nr:hypothetical protein [Actinomycetes bacterium]
MWRPLTTGRRLLIVLDDARDAEQVRPLLPGSGGSAVVITGRPRLYGLAYVHWLKLGGLGEDDSVALLESLVDAHLLDPGGLDRYYYHEPLRMFARSRAFADDGPEASQAALTRLVRFYGAEDGRLRAGA